MTPDFTALGALIASEPTGSAGPLVWSPRGAIVDIQAEQRAVTFVVRPASPVSAEAQLAAHYESLQFQAELILRRLQALAAAASVAGAVPASGGAR